MRRTELGRSWVFLAGAVYAKTRCLASTLLLSLSNMALRGKRGRGKAGKERGGEGRQSRLAREGRD
jgi:hypothetical protein